MRTSLVFIVRSVFFMVWLETKACHQQIKRGKLDGVKAAV